MKKIISVLLVFMLLSVNVYARNDNNEQKNLTVEKVAKQTGASEDTIDFLIDSGYQLSEMASMNKYSINTLLNTMFGSSLQTSQDIVYASMVMASSSGTVYTTVNSTTIPTGYTKVTTVPNNGGSNEYFNPINPLTDSNINSEVFDASELATNVFHELTSSNMSYSYYLFGEWGECKIYKNGVLYEDRTKWCHEGIDLKHITNATKSVYSCMPGIVTYSSSSKGSVNIYDSVSGITMNYQHLANIDGTGTLSEGSYVSVGQYLGNQNTNDKHVHVQTCNHASCSSVHSGREMNLECVNTLDNNYYLHYWY